MNNFIRMIVVATLAEVCLPAVAREPESPSALIKGLKFPTAVAIQPETESVFIAESGEGRIVRWTSGELRPVITGFPTVPLTESPEIELGPIGLVFLSKDTLLVSCRIEGNDAPLIRVYRVPEDLSSIRFEAALAAYSLGPLEDPVDSPAHLSGMTATADRVYATLMTDGQSGRIVYCDRTEEELSEIRTWIDIEPSLQSSHPSGLAISPHGYLVVSTMGRFSDQEDSRLAFFDISSKRNVLRVETGLYDVSSVLYSGRKQLYLLDSAWTNPASGGLYRSVADRTNPAGMIAKPIAALEHPTAMTFDSQGALLISSWGRLGESDTPQGAIWKLSADENL